jgi:crotonobetainyl-CoA:carnitine CoA-transferase CaiB-like acyl-CoA transferase
MFDHPQVLEQGYVTYLRHQELGRYRAFSGAFRFGATRKPAAFAAPRKGQHTRSVLEAHGFDAAEINRLVQCAAIEGP